jgi:hypothetical protein
MVKLDSFWATVGMIIGFVLGEVSSFVRFRFKIYQLKKIVLEEMKSIAAQIPQKKEIIQKAINYLERKEILSTFGCNYRNGL